MIYADLNGFSFVYQSGQGNRRHYALLEIGVTNGSRNILTLTIEDIND
jgi:hypothetical protein